MPWSETYPREGGFRLGKEGGWVRPGAATAAGPGAHTGRTSRPLATSPFRALAHYPAGLVGRRRRQHGRGLCRARDPTSDLTLSTEGDDTLHINKDAESPQKGCFTPRHLSAVGWGSWT